jgi:hypothetical protein
MDGSMNTPEIQPAFDIDLPGYRYIGRGPDATGHGGGWHRSERLFFRCIKCATMMPSVLSENWQCPCGSMDVDADYGRFGSVFGDGNVLVYERI